MNATSSPEILKNAFKRIADVGEGFISEQMMRRLMANVDPMVTTVDIDAAMKVADQNGDVSCRQY